MKLLLYVFALVLTIIPYRIVYAHEGYGQIAASFTYVNMHINGNGLCGPLQTVLKVLTSDRYREVSLAQFTHERMGHIVIFANPDTGTWTILRVVDDRHACVLLFGDDFQPSHMAPKPEEY